ncbi:unnamed protein product [Heligmosomoides polygyrus]|uniref:LRRCT domain-containing protein n=1 Tax=Heligmosomoides polygyrus TaxID=6339 RepID=A0A183GWT6_HELPZ|nr:unnamed protein product [Heligmosomoides polygyrus]
MEWLTKSKAKESGKALETTELTVSTSNAHKTNGQRNVCDLSDRRLTLLPESLLCSDTFEVHQLNLRRNSLSSRGTNDPSPVQLGWLDDLSRLVSLTTLDLSSNHLTAFPTSTVQLPNLQKLNLSSNCIQSIPTSIRLLRR